MKYLLILLLQLVMFGFSPLTLGIDNHIGRDTVNAQVVVERQSFNKYNSSLHYEMDVSYPFVKYPKADVSHNANLGVQNIMASAISEFRTNLIKLSKKNMGLSYLTLDYKVTYQKKDFLSVVFHKDTFYNGYKGTKRLVYTYNYDLKNRKQLLLSDFFDKQVDYKAELHKLLNSKSDIRIGRNKSYRSFTFTDKGILFIFDELTLNKNIESPLNILLRWDELEGLLSDNKLIKRVSALK